MSTSSCARSSVSHVVPGPCAATTTSTVPPYVPDGLDLVDREAPPQQVGARRPADGEGHELARAGELGEAGRHEGEVVVGADPAGRDELTGHLHDTAARTRMRAWSPRSRDTPCEVRPACRP